MKPAKFFKRILAFIIDTIIVTLAAALLSTPFVNVENSTELRKELNEVAQKYIDQEIDVQTYYKQIVDLNYEIVRTEGTTSLITVLVTILYFIVFQFYNKGQTLGKKLLKIKVINASGDRLTINNIGLRALLINTIVFDMLLLFMAFVFDKNSFSYSSTIIEITEYSFVIASIIMIIVRKDGRGLHDLLGNTQVVEE